MFGKLVDRWVAFLQPLTKSKTGLTGVIVASGSAVMLAMFVFLDLIGISMGPYFGIFIYLVLPGILLTGLILIPIGRIRYERRKAKGHPEYKMPIWDLNNPKHRFRFIMVAFLTMANVIIIAVASYGGLHYTESVSFCTEVCHSVMNPEFEAYKNGPHSKIRCVECHVGAGATAFMKAKTSGLRQVVGIVLNNYNKPIASPAHGLPVAKKTCESCHWSGRHFGKRRKMKIKYKEDEMNTPEYTVIDMKIGGLQDVENKISGIHWHMNKGVKIKYKTLDRAHTNIGWIEYTNDKGEVKTYVSGDYKEVKDKKALTTRKMDCLDCHNRPSHTFSLPDLAIDSAIRRKSISGDLPYIKKKGLELLTGDYKNKDVAKEIPMLLTNYYKENYGDKYSDLKGDIDNAAVFLVKTYKKNIHPQMKITWGTYKSFLGHKDDSGCLRCHNGDQETAEGETINDDCELCHDVIIEEETDKVAIKKAIFDF